MILSTQKIVNQLIRLLHFRPDIPTRNGGLDRKHKDPGLGQLGMHDLNELLNVLRDALRGFAARRSQIVVSRVHDHCSGMIVDDDAVGVMIDVRILGPAEAPVDHGERLHVFHQRTPIGNARRTCEDNPSGRHRMHLVLTFKRAD